MRFMSGGVGGAVDGDGLWTTARIELSAPSVFSRGAVDAQPLPFHTDHSPCWFAEPRFFVLVFRKPETRERETAWAGLWKVTGCGQPRASS
jgi:hypothetical protein